MKTDLRRFSLTLFLATVCLAACAMSDLGVTSKKQVYIDANLLFSISYPEAWAPFLTPHGPVDYTSHAVSWQFRADDQEMGHLGLTVFSIPENGFVTGFDMLNEVLLDIYPDATFTDRGTDDLPAGPAFTQDGTTPLLTFRAWILSKNGRHYLIVCTASTDRFSENIPLFRTITHSFQVLENPKHDQAD